MLRIFSLASFMFLVSCSPLDVAGSLLGGGPNVNAQLGQTNTQGVSVTSEAPSVSLRPRSRVETIDQSSSGNRIENAGVVNNLEGVPVSWLIITVLIGLLGWLIDKPSTIYRNWKNRGS